jgi:hypothetical protein
MRCGDCLEVGFDVALDEKEVPNPDYQAYLDYPHCPGCECYEEETLMEYTCPINPEHRLVCLEDLGLSVKKYDTRYGALTVLNHEIFEKEETE